MATDINKVVLVGRLVRDCGQQDFGYTQGGQAHANISIAVDRSRKQGDQWVSEVSFFDTAIWGKLAEALHPYLQKGKQVCIVGHLVQERWEKDGKKFSKVAIVTEDIQLLGSKLDRGTASTPAAPAGAYAPPQPPVAAGVGGDEFPEDIPF